jgi:hypothetical protein
MVFLADRATRYATPNLRYRSRSRSLVVVLVAQGSACRVQDVPDADSWADVVYIDGGVKCEAVASLVSSVDVVDTAPVRVLPDAEVAVNEGVVQPEDGVGGRCVGILHDSADTVVTPSVRTTLGTAGHGGVRALCITSIHHVRVCVGSLRVVVVTRKTMEGVARAGSNVDRKVSELLV